MVKKIVIVALLFISGINSFPQNQQDPVTEVIGKKEEEADAYSGFVHPGLFLFRASLAVGGLTQLKAGTVFVEGNMEYFVDRRVSVRGDGYFFAAHTGDYKPFKMHHSLFTGAMFHKYSNGDFDPYAGLEVGINYAQATDPYLGKEGIAVVPVEEASKVFSPTLSPVAGFNYYGGKFFHLTVHARYIVGRFMDNYNSVSLGEWRISFGLGFNLSRKLLNTSSEMRVYF